MKFGKNLSAKQAKYPQLRFLDYKGLKKILKAAGCSEEFFSRLNAEIDAINACFSSEISGIRDALAVCSELCLADHPLSSLLPSVMRMADQVETLRRFAVWNAVGVVKIIKKHSKLSGLISPYSSLTTESWLSKQLFFSGSDFDQVHATLESLSFQLARGRWAELEGKKNSELFTIPSIIFPTNSIPASNVFPDYRCPICLERCEDVVELTSCGHRFCWKCVVLGPIAFAPGEYKLSRCPVCRHEQPLDPTRNFVGSSKHLQLLAQLLDLTSNRDDEELSHLRDAMIACEDEEGLEDLFNTTSGGSKQPNEQKARQLLHELDDQNMAESALFCCLCCEPLLLEAITTTPCKHHFHRVCLTKYDKNTCPLCDQILPPDIIRAHRIFYPDDSPPSRVVVNRTGATFTRFSPDHIAQKRGGKNR